VDPKTQITGLIEKKNYEAAFELALQQRDLNLLNWIINAVEPEQIFPVDQPGLNNRLTLSLMQQLGSCMNTDTDIKLDWLQFCLGSLDPNDESIVEHSKKVLKQLEENILPYQSQYRSKVRILLHTLKKML